MKRVDLKLKDVRHGDMASHVKGFDPRPVGYCNGSSVWLIFPGGDLSGPFPVANYTFYRMEEEVGSPLEVSCPACQAKPGEPCTQATNVTRVRVNWFHLAREVIAQEKERED